MERALIEQLADSDTALVCNAMAALGLSEPHTYTMDGTIACLTPDLPPMVGRAVTIKLDSCTPGIEADFEPYHQMLEQMETAEAPRVVVCQTASGTPMRECVLGDGMAKSLVAGGGAGFVTDGGVRDLRGILDQAFPVFAGGQVPQHADMRWGELGEPVEVGGIEVRTGDLIHGDHGGCVVVPDVNHPWIVDACALVLDFEKRVHAVLRRTDIAYRDKRILVDDFVATHRSDVEGLRRGGS